MDITKLCLVQVFFEIYIEKKKISFHAIFCLSLVTSPQLRSFAQTLWKSSVKVTFKKEYSVIGCFEKNYKFRCCFSKEFLNC